MIPDQAWDLLTTDLPTELEPWVLRFAEAATFSERERRSYAWSMHLLSRLSGQAVTTAVMGVLTTEQPGRMPEVTDITAGFIPYEQGAGGGARSLREARMEIAVPFVEANNLRYAFGVVIGITPPEDSSDEVNEEKQTPSQVVSIDNYPVVVEYRRVRYSAPPNPNGATAACYAKPRASKRFFGPTWTDGIVIARHSLKNLGFSTGVSVPMANGGSCLVTDIDTSTTIDAVILNCGAVPSHTSTLSLATAVAPGSNVDVRTASRTFSAQVLRVNDHPSYYGNLIAHRLFLDTIGTPGDSGSLVIRTPHADSAGLYMGHTGGSAPEGLVQSMRQIVHYFDVDLFD